MTTKVTDLDGWKTLDREMKRIFQSELAEADFDEISQAVASGDRVVEILAPLNLSVAQLTVDERGQIEVVLDGGTVSIALEEAGG